MSMEVGLVAQSILATLAQMGLKVLWALVLWLVGRRLIGFTVNMLRAALHRQSVDPTLIRYLGSAVTVLLNIALVVAILGYFGIETTTFAAFVAGAGVAIGAAWASLLSNFAAGIFLIILQPFKTGDFVTAGGVTGTVKEVGLFGTAIDTPDNVHTVVGNGRIFADTIQNFSANPFRRVDLTAQLHHSVDPGAAVRLLKERIAKVPNVLTQPAPDVEILSFNLAGPVLAVRPYCHNDHYWQVYFESNRTIRGAFGEAEFPVPEEHYVVTSAPAVPRG
jgi:small conductance mechanosensitive channel